MARRSQHSFLKRQKEVRRKEEAAEKMARRQGKIHRETDVKEDETVDLPAISVEGQETEEILTH